jgi:hypothetical protein
MHMNMHRKRAAHRGVPHLLHRALADGLRRLVEARLRDLHLRSSNAGEQHLDGLLDLRDLATEINRALCAVATSAEIAAEIAVSREREREKSSEQK